MMVMVVNLIVRQMLLDLRARTMYQNQPDTKAGQQIEVVRQLDKFTVSDNFSAKSNNEGFAAKRIDIGRNRAKPCNEVGSGGSGDVLHKSKRLLSYCGIITGSSGIVDFFCSISSRVFCMIDISGPPISSALWIFSRASLYLP